MESLINSIQLVGFPVIICICFIYYFMQESCKEREENSKREERLYSMISKFSDSVDNLTHTLKGVDERLTNLERMGGQ